MKRQDHVKLEALSQLDDEIITRNVQKRYLLLRTVKIKKRISRSFIALAAVFALIISSVFLFMPDNSSTDKQVPIYQGMTVSNEAPVVEMATRVNLSMPLFGAIGMRFGTSSMPNTNKVMPETSAPEITTPEISGGPYYAQPNEDIYIHVHISNPDGFEILSFTLNGVKYSTYMFEEGSDLETLILKYNVGEKEGVQQYTIDAIKYVDGENIKDVRMEGNRTIEVLVGNDTKDLAFETQFESWDLIIEPKWTDSFTGEKTILTLGIYDGKTLLRELDPSDRTISNLPMDKRLLLVATYLDEGETITVTTVIQTRGQSKGLLVTNGVVTGSGSCTDAVLYVNMPIGDMAFKNNATIKQINFGSGVTSIGAEAFANCSQLTEIVIPPTVTSMGYGVFSGCSSLKLVIFENNMIEIPNTDSMFANCINLTDITLPNPVTSIGKNAFSGCTSLVKITMPEGLTNIGESAFMDCTALESMTMPNSVTTIGSYAFKNCTNITSMTISDGIKHIGAESLFGCTKIEILTLRFEPEMFGADVKCLIECFFGPPQKITSGLIDSSDIPSTLKTVVISGGEIPKYAFNEYNLTNIILSEGVTAIDSYAIQWCMNLKSITIPASVQSIATDAIIGNTYLKEINYTGTQEQWLTIRNGNLKGKLVHCSDGDITN